MAEQFFLEDLGISGFGSLAVVTVCGQEGGSPSVVLPREFHREGGYQRALCYTGCVFSIAWKESQAQLCCSCCYLGALGSD